MNRYFIPGEGRRAFPRRSYARLDAIEPVNLEEAREIQFSFDAVDADWRGFQPGHPLSLEPDRDAGAKVAAFWERRFRRDPPDRDFGGDPFDDLPLFQIELTVDRSHPWTEELLFLGNDWVEIDLDDSEGTPVDVYGGMFDPPLHAFMDHAPRPTPLGPVLDREFDMDNWPDATAGELQAVLTERCVIDELVMFDIGQGSAIGLVCEHGYPFYYFDVGCGVYRNAPTRPKPVQFCVCQEPVVLLSHWDSDHWAGATLDAGLRSLSWVTPRQSISPKHTTFGNAILKAGGQIYVVPPTLSPLNWGSHRSFTLQRCTGKATDRNASGLALVVENPRDQRGWLLTGDAGYNYIPTPWPADLAAVVVPHHGADMGRKSNPPGRSSHAYSRLLYSFGPGNAHGAGTPPTQHPTAAAVSAHQRASPAWPHGAWSHSPPPPGTTTAAHPVLATATHPGVHLNGARVGWTAAPSSAGHLAICTRAMPVTQS